MTHALKVASSRPASSLNRRLPIVIALALVSAVFASRGFSATPEQLEYEVKAAMIYNFAKFVEWPGTASGDLNFCVSGPEKPMALVEQTLDNKVVGGRTTRMVRFKPGSSTRCDVLFITGEDVRTMDTLLQSTAKAATLTISDSPDFVDKGGMIGLFLEDGRLRFAINPDKAERAGLKLSSKLLKLAVLKREGSALKGDR